MFGLKRFKLHTSYNKLLHPVLEVIFEDIERIVVRQQFTTSPKDFLVLCEVEWRRITNPEETLDRIIDTLDWFQEAIVISSDMDRTLCMIKGIYDEMYTKLFLYTTREFLCFIEFPMVLRKDFGIVNLIGPPDDAQRLIDFMNEWGSKFEILAIQEYFPRDSGLLTALTDKQLSALKRAYDEGFFDHPRRSDARRISDRMGIKHTTFLTHIRKGQRRILAELFGD